MTNYTERKSLIMKQNNAVSAFILRDTIAQTNKIYTNEGKKTQTNESACLSKYHYDIILKHVYQEEKINNNKCRKEWNVDESNSTSVSILFVNIDIFSTLFPSLSFICLLCFAWCWSGWTIITTTTKCGLCIDIAKWVIVFMFDEFHGSLYAT